MLKEIRDNINKGLALGNKRFTTPIEALTNRLVQESGNPRTTPANSFSRQSFCAQKLWRESSCLKAQVP
ncbi:MAG: hypothetical protein DRR19_25250 [Candidatus Parabeggiatoa sp. nov. 1]|nr:MAG: hypothetical protein DRR19_25250 [Gammaproteobacteria bacterium]